MQAAQLDSGAHRHPQTEQIATPGKSRALQWKKISQKIKMAARHTFCRRNPKKRLSSDAGRALQNAFADAYAPR